MDEYSFRDRNDSVNFLHRRKKYVKHVTRMRRMVFLDTPKYICGLWNMRNCLNYG